MKHVSYDNCLGYEFHPEHKGAPYFFDNKWANRGEFLESAIKAYRGLEYRVNPATKYNEGSDIESEKASVKSDKASLGCIYGESKEEILETYFKNTASEKFIWVVMINDIVHEFQMNKKEFREFCDEFGRMVSESGSHKMKIRFLSYSSKMAQWFER